MKFPTRVGIPKRSSSTPFGLTIMRALGTRDLIFCCMEFTSTIKLRYNRTPYFSPKKKGILYCFDKDSAKNHCTDAMTGWRVNNGFNVVDNGGMKSSTSRS